ncbi:hypothetical protein GCM10025331_55560 [Actinoplanes utahensis]|nr:hypothetical protein Aut01nite_63140 [Actinoplanes utahensis]
MRKKMLSFSMAAGLLVGAGGFAAPALAATGSGGAVTCGPSQQVKITGQASSSTAWVFAWVNGGVRYELPVTAKRTAATAYTGKRAVSSWAVAVGTTLRSYGATCV